MTTCRWCEGAVRIGSCDDGCGQVGPIWHQSSECIQNLRIRLAEVEWERDEACEGESERACERDAAEEKLAAAEAREKALREAVNDHSCEECGRVFGASPGPGCRRCKRLRALLAEKVSKP